MDSRRPLACGRSSPCGGLWLRPRRITPSCTAAETLLGQDFLCDFEVQNEIVSDINASADGWALHSVTGPVASHDLWMVILPAGIEAGTEEPAATTKFGGYHSTLCTLNGEVDDQDCFAPGAQLGVYSVSTDGNVNDQQPLTSTGTANGDGWLDWTIQDASHELFESITDPFDGTGWITTYAPPDEISDVCEEYQDWPGEAGGYDVVLNGHDYLVNPLLSNGLSGRRASGLERTATLGTNSACSRPPGLAAAYPGSDSLHPPERLVAAREPE